MDTGNTHMMDTGNTHTLWTQETHTHYGHRKYTHIMDTGNTHTHYGHRKHTHYGHRKHTHIMDTGNTHIMDTGNTHTLWTQETHTLWTQETHTHIMDTGNTHIMDTGNTHIMDTGNTHTHYGHRKHTHTLWTQETHTHIMDTGNTHTLWTLVCVQVSMYGLKQRKIHKLWSFVSKCPCMDYSFLQNTTSLVSFWYSWSLCGYFVMCSHTKPIATQEERHPNLWTKVATRHHFVGISVRLSLTPFSQCSSRCIIVKFAGFITINISDVHTKDQSSKVKVTEDTTNLVPYSGASRV